MFRRPAASSIYYYFVASLLGLAAPAPTVDEALKSLRSLGTAMWELKQKNFSAAYLSPELKAFPVGSFDPQGFWSSTEVTPLVLAARGRRATEYEEKGAPVDYRLLDPYPGEPNGLALLRRSAHPHAAILFFDWMLSEEGQTVLAQQVPRMTLRKGIKQIARHQELYKKAFVFLDPATLGANFNELIASYQQIFNLRVFDFIAYYTFGSSTP